VSNFTFSVSGETRRGATVAVASPLLLQNGGKRNAKKKACRSGGGRTVKSVSISFSRGLGYRGKIANQGTDDGVNKETH